MSLRWFFVASILTAAVAFPTDERAGDVADIVFQLFTRANPIEFQALEPNNPDNLEQSHFDPQRPTKIFAHGWNGIPGHGYGIRDEYLQREDLNIIAVDWTALASGINYPAIALTNVPLAGQYLGAFVDYLIGEGTAIESIHLMGWSLGAHVVGNAGAAVKSGKLPRITGLDPAGPGYTNNNTDIRLDPSDAEFVDVIQTNSGNLVSGGLGFGPPLGHVDFYPNGGDYQPGCPDMGCNHERCVHYFAESINSPVGFRSFRCESYESFQAGDCVDNDVLFMGDPTPSTAQGIYYLDTNDAPPFARG